MLILLTLIFYVSRKECKHTYLWRAKCKLNEGFKNGEEGTMQMVNKLKRV